MIFQLSFPIATLGCAWGFYGLIFAVYNSDFGKMPNILTHILKILFNREFLLYCITAFLMLCAIGWQPDYYWYYILPGLPYVGCSLLYRFFIPSLSTSNIKKIKYWVSILFLGIMFGISSIVLLILFEKNTIENLLFNISWSMTGFITGTFFFLIFNRVANLRSKIEKLVNVEVMAQFLIGLAIGVGINYIFS
ncbi:MAG: hypothetical protein GF364_09555 [Candidatus Lokiarchaeota archaeon]|nr:hypothetical protein [Candidatus Lokiarchaeota archaeon]